MLLTVLVKEKKLSYGTIRRQSERWHTWYWFAIQKKMLCLSVPRFIHCDNYKPHQYMLLGVGFFLIFFFFFKCYCFFVFFLWIEASEQLPCLFIDSLGVFCQQPVKCFSYSIVIWQFWPSASQWEWYLSPNSSVEEVIVPAPSLPWILCFEYCIMCSISLILLD